MYFTGALLAAQSSGKLLEFFSVRTLQEARKKLKRRLKRSREKVTKQVAPVTSAFEDDGLGTLSPLVGNENEFQLTDLLESFTTLRCTHPIRGFDFCPSGHSGGPTSSGGRKQRMKDKQGMVPDSFLVSLVKNILEVYTIPSHLIRPHISRSNKTEGEPEDTETSHQPSKVSVLDLHGHRSDVRCVCLSGDGRTVATCSSDGLKLWSMATMTCMRSCDCEGGYGVTLAFAPGSRYVILGTKQGFIQLIDTVSGSYI